jgi:hypothetical protein
MMAQRGRRRAGWLAEVDEAHGAADVPAGSLSEADAGCVHPEAFDSRISLTTLSPKGCLTVQTGCIDMRHAL